LRDDCSPQLAAVFFSFVFFFSSRRRHTRSKRDWSSDVCSSDLPGAVVEQEQQIDGVDCQVLSGSGDGQGLHAVACDGEGWGFVTRGEGELEELEVLASAAIESLS